MAVRARLGQVGIVRNGVEKYPGAMLRYFAELIQNFPGKSQFSQGNMAIFYHQRGFSDGFNPKKPSRFRDKLGQAGRNGVENILER